MSLKSQTRETPTLKSLSENLCSGFLRPEKIHRPQPGLKLRTLDLEASMLPRDHRGRLCVYEVLVMELFIFPFYP